MTISWNKPIETLEGQPAKLVYTAVEGTAFPRLIVYDQDGRDACCWVSNNGVGNRADIRNVPERVKLEGWIAVGDREHFPGAPIKTSLCYPTRERLIEACGDIAYAINLALVSEKCPEAITRCDGGK